MPYNRFVHEHIAGDVLPDPRLDPKTGANESVLGTGFWFLGEEVHSPVDIRQDQADRLDNRIDVMTKTFLGLTVALRPLPRPQVRRHHARRTTTPCSACSEGSGYRQVRFDGWEQNRQGRRTKLAKLARAAERLQPVSRAAEPSAAYAERWLAEREGGRRLRRTSSPASGCRTT